MPVVPSSAGAAGMLVPFTIDPGCTVLEIGAGNGDLTQALAERGALVDALEADADAAQQAGRRSAGLELVQVEHLTFSAWLKSRGSTKRSFDLILYREDQTSSGQVTADLELVVEAATGLLRPSGTLLLAIDNPWGLRAMLGSFASDSGSSRAMLQAMLNGHGFTEQRWLLPYPDSRAPEVIVDTEFLERPIGTSLTEMLVRRPLAAPNIGDLFVTDPLKAFQSAVRAGLAADVADVFLVSATRHGQVDDVTRNGRMWLVPPAGISTTWQRPRELLEISDRWLIHPLGSYEGMRSGPLHLAPVTIEAPAGKSGEDVLVEALIGPGPFAAVTQGLVRAWWNAASSVIARAEPGQHPLDLRPRHFAVNESGDWTYLTQDLSFRFQVPAEVLALAAMAHTIVEAVLPRGWMRGLEPSMSVADAARFLLDTIDISCGDEHVMLWLSLEADIRVRLNGSGLDHAQSQRQVREFAEMTIGSMLDRLPLAARIEAGVAATRLAAEAESRRSEIAEMRAARDAAAEAKMRAELESERLRGVVSRLRTDLESLDPMRNRDDGAAALKTLRTHAALRRLASSEVEFEAAQRLDQPWFGAAELILEREGVEHRAPLLRAPGGTNPAVLVPPGHIVKLYGPWGGGHAVRDHDSYQWELSAIRRMEHDPALPVPRLVANGVLDEAWQYIVLTFATGTPLHDLGAPVTVDDLASVATWLGRFVRNLHAIPLDENDRIAGWSRFRAQLEWAYSTAATRLADQKGLPARLIEQIEDWLPPVAELLGSPKDAVMTHSDLTPAHIVGYLRGSGFEPTRVIGFGNSEVGQPLFELGPIWWTTLKGDRRLLDAFLAEADLPGCEEEGFPSRALAWAIVNPRWAWPTLPGVDEVSTLDELAARSFGPQSDAGEGARAHGSPQRQPRTTPLAETEVLRRLDALSMSRRRYMAERDGDEPWVSAATQVVEREGIEVDGQLQRAESGSRPSVFIPPGHLIKFYGPWDWGHFLHAQELEAMSWLARDPDLPVPSLVADGSMGKGWRYVVLTWLAGDRLCEVDSEVGPDGMADVAAWLGRFVRSLHAVPLEPAEREARWDGYCDEVAKRHRDATRQVTQRNLLPAHLVEQIDEWLPSISELLGPAQDAVLVHGDLTTSNIIGRLDVPRFEPTRIIDFNQAVAGHPMWDLGPLWWSVIEGVPNRLERFMAAAQLPGGSDRTFPRSALAWALVNPSWRASPFEGLEEVSTLDELADRAFRLSHE